MSFLRRFSFWIFDLDGTLTRSILDFPKIKRQLGLPPDRGILEVLAEMERERALRISSELDAIEFEMAGRAKAADGAELLLETLAGRNCRVGVLTRNKKNHALRTLRLTGLRRFFLPDHILGREEAAVKPSPEGVHKLLRLWRAPADRTVMAGDYLFDLQAGRAAGAATVFVDPKRSGRFSDWADITVSRLDELLDFDDPRDNEPG